MVNPAQKDEKAKTTVDKNGAAPAPQKRLIELPPNMTVRQLADTLQVTPIDIIKQLMRSGIMANINQVIDFKTASTVAAGFDIETKLQHRAAIKARVQEIKQQQKQQQGEQAAGLQPRPPVITIMGHVDHGKTKLLDAIRQSNVVDQEAGGITQHIGAYQIELDGEKMTFLDTPGHAAFTAMRARGAQVTDITVLVVAADDGVMPQTLEAIDHARAAGVPIIVAINKIDKPGANPDRIKQQLAEHSLLVEDWGGETISVPVSAKEKKGITELLETIKLVAEMEELKADPNKPAEGSVVEAKMDHTRGVLFTVLVNSGTLKEGDVIVVGSIWGKVKAMFNDSGKRVKRAPPSTPVEVLGLDSVPEVGDVMTVVADEKAAQVAVDKLKLAAPSSSSGTVNLSNLYEQVNAGKVKELAIILKTDVQGSMEPIRNSLEKLSSDQIKVHIIHSGTGNVTESDVMLAVASKAVIIGFSTSVEPGAKRLAEHDGVSIRVYDIIYNLVDDVEKALKGMLQPKEVEVIDGHAEIRAVFPAGKKEKAAGVYVTDGKILRGDTVRVVRGGKIVHESTISSLRRFKDDVREVATGYECGIGIQGFSDYVVGDKLEFLHIEKAS
ncbi:MAG TPA: translation initiation factor IF-2 [Dehalococcoidales bacterium]|nr:translation initiation factor IF-2 [Dehalococcoidales bacterium]